MRKWRKRPLEIEAEQITEDNIEDLAEWCKGRVVQWETTKRLEIRTFEGTLYSKVGHWVAKGIKGEFYPIEPGIFAETYEEVPDGDDTEA